jgi:hypothetical protein
MGEGWRDQRYEVSQERAEMCELARLYRRH